MSVRIDKMKLARELYHALQQIIYSVEHNAFELPDWDGTYFIFKTPAETPSEPNCIAILCPIPRRFAASDGVDTNIKVKVGNPATGRDFFPLFTEPARAHYNEFQGFRIAGTTAYYLLSRAGGTQTSTSLTGQNWTVERTFRLSCTTSATTGYVDGAQVGQNTTNISTVEPRFFWTEILDYAGTNFTTQGLLYVRPDAKGRIFIDVA